MDTTPIPEMLSTWRHRIVDLALTVDRWTADPTSRTRGDFLELVAPSVIERTAPGVMNDAQLAQRQSSLAALSTCGLVVRGLWRRAGVHAPSICTPYRIGRAIADVVEIGRTAQAWRTADTRDAMPNVGDVPLYEAPEHVGILVDVQRIEPDTLRTLEICGGQRNERGYQQARSVARVWTWEPTLRAWATHQSTKTQPRSHLVHGWIDWPSVAAQFRITA
jgi:hypothetical protein